MGATDSRPVPDFSWSDADEPHVTRRRLILEAHPEMKDLFGPEIKTFPMTIAVVVLQFVMAYCMRDSPFGLLFLLAYAIGGTANHTLQLANHELSHNLCFQTETFNRLLGIVANLPTGVPSSVQFRKYHMEHHQYQGVDGMDTDVPTPWEVRFFNNVALKKLTWVLLQAFAYGIRPLFVKPKAIGLWENLNLIAVMSSNVAVVYFWGWRSFAYLIIGTFLGLGLHPAAGHFIAEHYEFTKGAETYSYYGPWNYLNFNVGYHNEHLDFPKVAWSRLPMVRKIAPEFYEYLPYHTSYLKVIWDYITDPRMSPASRVKRVASPAASQKK